jgi:aspartyl-tRNA(Asn)/glutamyl-tRNA(Gln) amidotransferase subunit A
LLSIAVKDNIATVGSRTTCGSGILREYKSPFEAGVVRNLHLHDYAVRGKTNLDEFGMGSHSTHSFFGHVTNAWPFNNLSAGGSSGGSAAAVASGQCSAALGTDTGGSVRLPAAYTGVVGFKPSYGTISRWGVVPYANSMDTVGIMASDVASIKEAFHKAKRHDPRDPTCISDKAWKRLQPQRNAAILKMEAKRRRMSEAHALNMVGVRIGVPLEYNISELEPGIRQAWRDCLLTLQDQGAVIVPVSLPNTKHALSAYYVLAPAEAASNLSKYDGVRYGTRDGLPDGSNGVLYSRTRGTGFGDEVKRRILLGSYTLSSEAVDNYFLKAQKVRRLVQRDFDRIFAAPNPLRQAEQFDLKDIDESIQMSSKLGPTQVDFIVCPTAPTLPPTLDDASKQTSVDTYMNDVLTVPASLAGIPAISVPFPIPEEFLGEGKPAFAGMQIIGQYATDSALITIAETMVNRSPPTESKRPTQEIFAELHDKWSESKQKGGKAKGEAPAQNASAVDANEHIFKKGRNPVLEVQFPIRKTTTVKGMDPKAKDGQPLIWKIAQKRKALENENGEPLIQKVGTEKKAILAPGSEGGELRIRKIETRGLRSPLPVWKWTRLHGEVRVPNSEEGESPIRRIGTEKGRDLRSQLHILKPLPKLRIHKYISGPLLQKYLSNKGGSQHQPKTDKEVNKVFEDALGTWEENH